jgi:hypothetical protein
MPNKPKNLEGWLEKLYELSYKHNNEITLAMDDILELLSQARQQARDEAVGEATLEIISMLTDGTHKSLADAEEIRTRLGMLKEGSRK